MNTQTVCDVNGKEIKEGASIVYAVRDGSCMAALRKGTVVGVYVEPHLERPDDYFIDVMTEAGRRVTLSFPERIAVIERVIA